MAAPTVDKLVESFENPHIPPIITFMNLYNEKFCIYHLHTNYHLLEICLHWPVLTCVHIYNYHTIHLYVITIDLTHKDHYYHKMTLSWTFIMKSSVYTILIWISTSWSCVYIDIHLPAHIYNTRIPYICMQLLKNSHIKTVYWYKMTLQWTFIIRKYFI